MNGININEGNDFSVSNLLWGNANISINKKQRGDDKSIRQKTANYKITVNHTTGGPTHFIFNTDKIEASTQINQLSANEISLEAGEKANH